MERRRLVDFLGELSSTARDGLTSELCGLSSRALGVTGAGVMVMDGDTLPASLCASNAVATEITELEFTLGEGPGLDAHRRGTAVGEPDLAHPRQARWPSFAPAAIDAGVGALFSFPLRVGAVRLGALTMHRAHSGALSDDQHADALTMADLVVQAVLDRQAGAPPGALARELEELNHSRAEVHQASGMLSVQLGVSLSEALVRLRANAFAEGRSLAAVAGDVVARRIEIAQ